MTWWEYSPDRLKLAWSKMKVNEMEVQHLKYARKRVIFLYNK